MGDVPYDEAGERLFPVLAEEISRADVDFVVHIGDVKSSTTACSDSLLTTRIRELAAIRRPLVYVPGDNEWTDCHRASPGAAAPLERLAFLRALAYPEPGRTLGTPPMEVESQALSGTPEFPEHQRWSRQGVVFTTLHVVGSRNGLAPFPGRNADDDDEVGRRVAATVSWLDETFAQARDRQALAVVVAFQANPWHAELEGDLTGFTEVVSDLRHEVEAFGRPVLLIHGDSHTFRLDRPFWSEEEPEVPNLLRLETYGAPDVGWVEVHVDPTSRAVFGFTPHPVVPR